MNLGLFGKFITWLGTATALFYAAGLCAFWLAFLHVYEVKRATAFHAAALVDGKLVIALGAAILGLPFLLSVTLAWVLSLTDSQTVEETRETQGGATKTTTKVTTTAPRHNKQGDWPKGAKFVLLALIALCLVVIALYYRSQRDELGKSLPHINMLERDEDVATLNGVLLSHDAEYWYVLVDVADPAAEANKGDIKIVTLDEANNVRITK